MNQQLAQLIRDAVWLKSYLAADKRQSQEAFQLSHAALGPPQGPAQVPFLQAFACLAQCHAACVGPPSEVTPDAVKHDELRTWGLMTVARYLSAILPDSI